jgi:hypothetical protein
MISVRAIVEAVCEESGYSRAVLLSDRRHAPIVRARQIAMWLAARHTRQSLAGVGRAMGGRDHTTVIHSIERIDALCAENRDFADRVATLDRQIALARQALDLMQVVEADIDPVEVAAEILMSTHYRRATTLSVREIVALAEAVIALSRPSECAEEPAQPASAIA